MSLIDHPNKYNVYIPILEKARGGPILFWTKLKIHAICCLKNMLYSRRK